MQINKESKQIASNTAYTIGGSLLMNGVLQLIIIPLMYRYLGEEQLGVMLYITGLVAIVCPSVGQALNTGRLVVRRDYDVSNGDYNILLLGWGILGSAAALLISGDEVTTVGAGVLTVLLLMFTIFRYYGDVEYRLNLNYKKYFVYYAVLTAGYLLGFGLYFVTDSWFFIYLTGEVLAIGYLAVTGTVFRGFFRRSPYFSVAFRRGSSLVCSYLITNLTLNMDRLVLKQLVSASAVTQYYAASLIGKTMVLLVAPVNTILISYLTKKNTRMNRKQFLKFAGAGLLVSFVFFIGAEIATPLFLWLFYRDLYATVKPLIWMVNLTQILALLSAYLFMVVLTFTKETWQFALQAVHLIVMGALVLLAARSHGLEGYTVAALCANTLRVAAVLVLGFVKSGNGTPNGDVKGVSVEENNGNGTSSGEEKDVSVEENNGNDSLKGERHAGR